MSCATLLNSSHQKIVVQANQPSSLTFRDSVTAFNADEKSIKVPRGKDTLKLILTSRDTIKVLKIKPYYSGTYFLNVFPSPLPLLGFLVDRETKTPKKYAYPRYIYVDMGSENFSFKKTKPKDTTLTQHRNIVKVSFLSLFNYPFLHLEMGYERLHNRKFATQINVSAISVGFKLGLEERRYFTEGVGTRYFFATEVAYSYKNYLTDAYFTSPDDYSDMPQYEYLDNIGVIRQTLAVISKIGGQSYTKNRKWCLEYYLGGGVMYRDVKNYNRINPNDKMVFHNGYTAGFKALSREVSGWTARAALNIKLGYAF